MHIKRHTFPLHYCCTFHCWKITTSFVLRCLSGWEQVGHGAWWPRQPLRRWNRNGKRDGSSGAGGLPPIPLVHVQRTGAEEIHPVSSCVLVTFLWCILTRIRQNPVPLCFNTKDTLLALVENGENMLQECFWLKNTVKKQDKNIFYLAFAST